MIARPVVASLCGGLGNQMFQYACGRALALRLGVELLLDLSWFEHISEGTTERLFQLDAFPNAICKLASKEDIRSFTFRRRSFLDRLLRRPAARVENYIQEPSFAYWPGIEDVHAPAYLSGYWQNEGYFAASADAIRQDFTFPELPSGEANDMARRILAAPHAVSVHVRRGDYVSNSVTAACHGLCSPAYYQAALQHISDVVGNSLKLFLFSDDPIWVRENFDTHGLPATVVDFPEHAVSPWHDMHLMCLCRHHIIANSSFSWWVAWLAQEGETVCAPSHWFAAEEKKSDTPVPDRWIRL